VEKAGLIIALILILVSAIVVFNTIRLVVYTSKDEISVMKLVGASNVYVRGPWLSLGSCTGSFGIIALVLMAAFAYWSDLALLRFAGVEIATDFGMVVNVLSRYFSQKFQSDLRDHHGAGIIPRRSL